MAYERLVPGTTEWDLYYANHQSRYQFALELLMRQGSRKVLDAATGVGYGANFLSVNGIEAIVAIDRNEPALQLANKRFKRDGIQFVQDDCEAFQNCRTGFPYDAVVSFETLEHLPHPDLFLKNCAECLAPGGLMIVSTPNRLVSSPNGIKDWEYHEKEYIPDELVDLLRHQGFVNIKIYAQDYTPIGRLRQNLRGELNSLNFNPFIKLGKWFQKTFRGRNFKVTLPEKPEDFEILEYPNPDDIVKKGLDGPFVLIAVCNKTL